MTPMFIQEPFWSLTHSLPDAWYISINEKYQFLPEQIDNKGIAILEDIGKALEDIKSEMERKGNYD